MLNKAEEIKLAIEDLERMVDNGMIDVDTIDLACELLFEYLDLQE